jgi:hypothetical protein
MASLLDIAESRETVTVRGTAVAVPGISADGIARLLTRFDDLRGLLSGEVADISVEALAGTGPHVVAAVIAAGTGLPGDERAEAVAGDLSVTEQMDLLEAILRATFPAGMGEFAARLQRLAGQAGAPEVAVAAGD